MTRNADIGRRQAYSAEKVAWGGYWYEETHTSRLLKSEADARAFHKVVVAEARKIDPKLPSKDPGFIIRKNAKCSYWSGRNYECQYVEIGRLHESTIIHEVAHWATPWEIRARRAHGKEWREFYAALMRALGFIEQADRFLRACEELPVMRAASVRKKWQLQTNINQAHGAKVWKNCPPGTLRRIPNAVKCSMHRGNEEVVTLDGKSSWFRMVPVSD